jgi:argininosuccinate lyase
VAFRDAHHIVGRMVGEAAKRGIEFNELPDSEWESLPGKTELRTLLTFDFSINRRSIEGGTGKASVEEQFRKAERLLEDSGK